jgi:hypothetical protein
LELPNKHITNGSVFHIISLPREILAQFIDVNRRASSEIRGFQ